MYHERLQEAGGGYSVCVRVWREGVYYEERRERREEKERRGKRERRRRRRNREREREREEKVRIPDLRFL